MTTVENNDTNISIVVMKNGTFFCGFSEIYFDFFLIISDLDTTMEVVYVALHLFMYFGHN